MSPRIPAHPHWPATTTIILSAVFCKSSISLLFKIFPRHHHVSRNPLQAPWPTPCTIATFALGSGRLLPILTRLPLRMLSQRHHRQPHSLEHSHILHTDNDYNYSPDLHTLRNCLPCVADILLLWYTFLFFLFIFFPIGVQFVPFLHFCLYFWSHRLATLDSFFSICDTNSKRLFQAGWT